MKRLVVFASGSGSNAENIVQHFTHNENVEVAMFLTNNPDAGVISRGRRLGIPILVFDKNTFSNTSRIVGILKDLKIDMIILGGFLWKIPENLIEAFPNKIINIHPALLPNYGGKGMWGHHVHEAVIANKEKESGITIHYVNEHYDEGQPIFQAKCLIEEKDNPDTLAQKVQALEAIHFPRIIEEILKPL